MKPLKLITGLGLAALATSANGMVIFTDSFENPPNPTVSGVTTTVPDGWVGSDQGFGSGNRGLANEDTGGFTTTFGAQAASVYFFDNAGLTTQAGTIGTVTAGVTYTLSFYVASQDSNTYDYNVLLVSFGVGEARNDVRNSFTDDLILAQTSGSVATSDMSKFVSFSYTATAGDPGIGEDLAIRIHSVESNPVFFDNFQVDAVPEPSAALLGALGLLALLRRQR